MFKKFQRSSSDSNNMGMQGQDDENIDLAEVKDDHDASDVSTVPFDPRFPNQNQTLNCFTNYVDYYRCRELMDNDERCEYFKKVFTSLCPNAWVSHWDEQREIGTFPNPIIRVPEDYCDKIKK